MKSRLLIFAAVLVVFALLVFWPGRKGGDRQPQTQPAPTAQQPPRLPADHPDIGGAPLPQVEGIRLGLEDPAGEQLPPLDLKPGEVKAVPGTPYAVRFTEFYTHWNYDTKPSNLSFQEVNPAVKVEVLKGGEVLYHGWAFKNMPFFRMGGHQAPGGGAEGDTGRFAFALIEYRGLHIPSGESAAGQP